MDEARYDSVAGSYGVGPDDYSAPATRALLSLSANVAGLRVLDLACGTGLIARELGRSGGSVVGVDISDSLLVRAKHSEDVDPLGIVYVQGDGSSKDLQHGEQFDLVVCNFGMSDIDDLDGACSTVARLLSAGGRFVFSILHPCFPGIADVSASWATGGRYYDEGWWRADGERSTLRKEVGANHRMLSTYLNALYRHGLVPDQLVEPEPEEDWVDTRPGAGAFPVYLVVRCHRLMVEQA